MEQLVKIFKALGDETRLKILILLSRKMFCAKGIARHLDISEAAVSQHIKILKEADAVVGEKVGYYVHYDIKEPVFSEIVKFVEQLTGNTLEYYQVGVKTFECRAQCKATKKKCCQKNEKGVEKNESMYTRRRK